MTRETSNLPINYAEQLRAEAAEIAKRIAAPTGDRIRFNGGSSFTTPDNLEGDELEVVVIDFLSTNMYYDSDYDRNDPQPPACFAIGPEPAVLIPSGSSPNKQADACAVCPQNQFGSAGKGKACKNTRLLAVMPLHVEGNPIWIMSVPPTSIRAFDSYVHKLAAKQKLIPAAVLTSITMEAGAKFAAPRFEVLRPLTDDELNIVMPMREEANSRLMVEPDVSNYHPPKPRAGRR